MSAQLRSWFAALVISGLSTSPAFSNALTDLFSVNASPGEKAAPAPAEEACLLQPGKSTGDGQHWFYRYDGGRRCWFQAPGRIATVKSPTHRHAAKLAAGPEERDVVLRRKGVVDARDELMPPEPAEALKPAPKPAPPMPAVNLVDAAPVPGTAAALVPQAPVVAQPSTDQLTPDRSAPVHVDVETLLADAPAASDAIAPGPPTAPVDVPSAEGSDHERGPTATWAGALLIALGCVVLLWSNRTTKRNGRVAPFRRTGQEAVADGRMRSRRQDAVP